MSLFPIETVVAFDAATPPRAGNASLVTVAVSLFDYAHHLAEGLDSIAAQTHARLDLIVVDDASRDDSATVARAWLETNAARFERARLIRHAENQGLSQARNTAFAAAIGHAVFVMDADNAIYPRAIARLAETLADTGAAVAYSQIAFFGDGRGPGYADVWMRERFRPANYVDAIALVSVEAWAAVGGYAPLDIGWEDFDFWCGLIEHGYEGVFVPEMLCRYRVHQSSMLRTETDRRQARIVQALMARHPWLALEVR